MPNGEIAIIPETWLTKYADLFALSETEGDNEKPVLRKHHLNLVKELEDGNLAKVHLSEKLTRAYGICRNKGTQIANWI